MINTKVLGGILLLTGTCVGAGMLAVPVVAAPAGFTSSLVLLVICWLAMYLTGLLVLEVDLWLAGEPNYVSMAKETLGPWGGVITWFAFLLLLYSLIAAYITGGGELVLDAVAKIAHYYPAKAYGPLLWMLVFGLIVYLGAKATDYVNRVMMFGLVIAFSLIMATIGPEVEFDLLNGGDKKYIFAALPVIITSFGFHIIIPSMRNYLQGDIKQLRRMMLLGSLLPLFIYIFWQCLVFGVIPLHSTEGLIHILQSGETVSGLTQALSLKAQFHWVLMATKFFAFFAIASSFLGVSYGLFDLLADGLKMPKDSKHKYIIALLTFIPPLIYALVYPNGFIIALGYAGIFVAILHGLLPVAMAWSGRYLSEHDSTYRVKGGKPLLVVLFVFFTVIIFADLAAEFHLIPTMN